MSNIIKLTNDGHVKKYIEGSRYSRGSFVRSEFALLSNLIVAILYHGICASIHASIPYKNWSLTGIGIPIMNLRRSEDRLRYMMGIPIPLRGCPLSE